MNSKNVRIQISCYGVLQAEVIVENYAEALKVWAAFTNNKYRKGKVFGGAIFMRADLRHWDVKVGWELPESEIDSLTYWH